MTSPTSKPSSRPPSRAVAPRGDLRPVERDDLRAELFALAWQLSERYDRERGFSTFLYSAAQRRTVDFVRRERGRTRWKAAATSTNGYPSSSASTITSTTITPEGTWILQQIALRISLGYSQHEVSAALDWPTWAIGEALEQLREELVADELERLGCQP
jgi:hypothetical protein